MNKSAFICPVCNFPLEKVGNCFRCEKNHSFDIAKSGYVNLLMSQKNSQKRHGDDKLMIKARSEFLNAGFYKPLCDKIIAKLHEYSSSSGVLLDIGCGDSWYTGQVEKSFFSVSKDFDIFAIDISKAAVEFSAKRNDGINFAIASAFKIPMADNSCDIVLSIFAPYDLVECQRLLKKGGIFLRAIPLENHLMGLKKAVYDKAYANVVDNDELDGFELISSSQIKGEIVLTENSQILNLFMMTPYYYKTSEKDQKKLDLLSNLRTEIEFEVRVYRKSELHEK